MDIPRRHDALLICMVIYVGAGIPLKIWDIFCLELDSSIASAVPAAPDIRPTQGNKARVNPMETYRVIWERNLFKAPSRPGKRSSTKISMWKKSP